MLLLLAEASNGALPVESRLFRRKAKLFFLIGTEDDKLFNLFGEIAAGGVESD